VAALIPRRRSRLVASAVVGGALVSAGLATAAAAPTGPPATAAAAGATAAHAAAGGDFARRVEIGGVRKLFLHCRGRGTPTVVLVSGSGDAGDVWGEEARVEGEEGLPDLYPGVDLPVRGPAVLRGVARLSRVCVYDRPSAVDANVEGAEVVRLEAADRAAAIRSLSP
jgi:hypothetical protein